jgi:hypothetical protein
MRKENSLVPLLVSAYRIAEGGFLGAVFVARLTPALISDGPIFVLSRRSGHAF